MSNRDPSDTTATVKAVFAYFNIVHNYTYGKPDEDDIATADVAFEKALLDLGVINPSEVIAEICATDTEEGVAVTLDSGEGFIVRADGSVDEQAA